MRRPTDWTNLSIALAVIIGLWALPRQSDDPPPGPGGKLAFAAHGEHTCRAESPEERLLFEPAVFLLPSPATELTQLEFAYIEPDGTERRVN